MYLSFLVDTRFQLQAEFLDIFRSISILDEIEGEEVGVLCVLKTEKRKSVSTKQAHFHIFLLEILLTEKQKKPQTLLQTEY